jgi:DNA-binding transcriptional MerR regulator
MCDRLPCQTFVQILYTPGVSATESEGLVRIGELARRTGVSPELLRAWERRYALLRPQRSDGGFRLYSREDEERVGAMLAHVEAGLSAAEAARLALQEARPAGGVTVEDSAAEALRAALASFDDVGAHAAFDTLLASFSVEAVLRDAVLPALRDLGERWARGELTVAQEHFASNLLRGRLLGLARGWDRGRGPRAVLACAPGEQHDLGLLVFGIALRDHGWRITFLGADTPLATLSEAVEALAPELVVVAATQRERLAGLRAARVAASLAVAGSGVDAALAKRIGASHLADDPLTAAAHVASSA